MASVQDLGKCSASRCTSYGILYFECSLKWLETKCSDTPTISIDDWGVHLDDQTFCIFCNGWIDCRDVFHAVLHI